MWVFLFFCFVFSFSLFVCLFVCLFSLFVCLFVCLLFLGGGVYGGGGVVFCFSGFSFQVNVSIFVLINYFSDLILFPNFHTSLPLPLISCPPPPPSSSSSSSFKNEDHCRKLPT